MEKGDLFWAKDGENHPHPIVFLKQIDRVRFKACILSSKSTSGNILMRKEHFNILNESGEKYTIIFKNSHIVPNRKFIKEKLWLASNKAQGKLTEEGLMFIKQYVGKIMIDFKFPIWELPSRAIDILIKDLEYRECKDIVVVEKASGNIFKVMFAAKEGQESTVFFNEKGEAVSETGELIQQAQAPAQEESVAPEEPAE